MNHHLLKHFATNTLCLLIVSLCAGTAFAGVAVGTVTLVSGPLLAKKENGALKALGVNSFVELGDVLVSEKDTYARIKFADDSEITLKPNTQLKIETFSFNDSVPGNLGAVFSVSKGAVHVKTGMADQRGNSNMKLVMPSLVDSVAAITVKREPGTTFVAEYVPVLSPKSQLALVDVNYPSDSFQPVRWRVKAPEKTSIRNHGGTREAYTSQVLRAFSLGGILKNSALLSKFAGFQLGYLAALENLGMPLGRHGSFTPVIRTLAYAPGRAVEPLLTGSTTRRGELQLAQANRAPKPPGLPAGLYVSVIDGAINLTNRGGSTNFAAGQFGYTANISAPPVVVPANPGLKFTPPPTFAQSSGQGASGSGSKAAAIDCEVR